MCTSCSHSLCHFFKGLQRSETLWGIRDTRSFALQGKPQTGFVNLNCPIPRALGYWDLSSTHHLDPTFDADVIYLMTFLLGSASPLTNVLSLSSSSSCLQSLLFSSVSLLITCVRPRHPRVLLPSVKTLCSCTNVTQPPGGHAGSWQPYFSRVLTSYQGCALGSSLCGVQSTCWLYVLIFT